jgi:murein DD-endopeptidase MepM/ murein hydrolase activator NlpD
MVIGAPILNHNFTKIVDSLVNQATKFVQQHPQSISAAVVTFFLIGTGATFAVANLDANSPTFTPTTIVETVQSEVLTAQIDALQSTSLRLFRSETSRSTDNADTLLKRLGVFDPQAVQFLRADSHVQSLLLGRAGRNVTVEVDDTQALLSLKARWSPINDGTFQRLTVTKTPQGLTSKLETVPLVANTRLASGTIYSSLFAATDAANIPDAVAVQMAEIFSSEIDFHRALRKGDRFSVVYETLEGDGEPLRSGKVLSAEFINGGATHHAMWFNDPAAADSSKGGYYTLDGESMRRAFLASPMEFSRVSSGFKMRFHPILQKWRAHLGVDYAAPTGTPVRSVGNGSVEFAGVKGGFGNVVIIRHDKANTTLYAHLSKIGVRKGQKVSQGQHIGAVGMTGWATGPHLHFEFQVNGQHRDPLTLAKMSPSVPVSAQSRTAFTTQAAQVRRQLASAAQIQAIDFE